VFVTKEISAAHNFFCEGLERHDHFPLDRQWICTTNKLVNQTNHHLQQWRTQDAQSFGIISAFIQLIQLLSNCPGLSKAQQINFIEKIDRLELPSNDVPILEGDLFVLMRNIGSRPRLAKRRPRGAIKSKNPRRRNDSKRAPDRKSDSGSQNISFLSDFGDFEVFEVSTIVTDNKRSPDRKSDTWSQNISFLSDLSDFGDFEVFEVSTVSVSAHGSTSSLERNFDFETKDLSRNGKVVSK
jgi:hypothetical protein